MGILASKSALLHTNLHVFHTKMPTAFLFLQRLHMRAGNCSPSRGWHRPAYSVCDDTLYMRMIKRTKCFMPRLKIKYAPQPSGKGYAAAKYFAGIVPGNKNGCIRLRDIKIFAVHFFSFQFKIRRNSLSDWMSGATAPQPFPGRFIPPQGTAGTQQFLKDLGVVAGVVSRIFRNFVYSPWYE